jgi:hypothetical protein
VECIAPLVYTLIDDATVVVFSVVVVLGTADVVVREGTTTPDAGRVISPIGLMIVGPASGLRGTKMMPTIPAAMSTKHTVVHQNRDVRLFFEDVTTLNVVESGSKSLSPYARRRRRSTSPRPAMPKKRSRMLTMSTPPLTEDVADPPSPVLGAPEGIVAGGMCGGVVGGLLLIVVVDVIGGTDVVVDVGDVVEVVDVVDVVPGGVVGIDVDVTGTVDVVDVVEVVDVGDVVDVVDVAVRGIVEVVDVVDDGDVVEVVIIGDVVDVVDCELTVNGSQSPVEPGYDAVPLPV